MIPWEEMDAEDKAIYWGVRIVAVIALAILAVAVILALIF